MTSDKTIFIFPSMYRPKQPLPATSLCERMIAWLTPITFVTHHTRFATAPSIVVTLCAEGACQNKVRLPLLETTYFPLKLLLQSDNRVRTGPQSENRSRPKRSQYTPNETQ